MKPFNGFLSRVLGGFFFILAYTGSKCFPINEKFHPYCLIMIRSLITDDLIPYIDITIFLGNFL